MDPESGTTNYVPVRAKAYPASKNALSVDAKFWRSFRNKSAPQQISAVTCIQFSPAEPHDFAVTSSTRVVVYDGVTCEPKKNILRFTDVAYSGSFRSDGQLLAAGGETGIVQVFDVGSRKVLRQLKAHTGAVHWVRYSPQDKLHIASAGDDRTVRWWDVATQAPLLTLEGHTDYVRCGATSPASGDLWATGAYDHTVRLWDFRTSRSVLQFEHGKPLEDVLFFPSGGLLASAGGQEVKIWDIVGGGRQLHVLSSHQKTVTTLCMAPSSNSRAALDQDAPRLLTASLDGHVKVFELSQFKVTHAAKYPAPILSMGVSPDCTTLAVGTSSGLLSIRQRKKPDKLDAGTATALGVARPRRPRKLHPNNYRYFLRGGAESAAEDDYVLARPKKVNLGQHDQFLRSFQYREALSSALSTSDPTVVVAVMEELVARGGLVAALSRRDVSSLEPLLAFICKYVVMPKQARLLVPIAHQVLDMYAGILGSSSSIWHLVTVLRERVALEVKLQQSLQSLQGLMQPLIQASVQS
ncbi:unnamed protein product [Sphagnum troendelagicum]|uniref:U3 small nucleolar RNA-associated protein 15 C-terminal domain-containing protein n=1 Tax=Sphagnum troendelagicum TaxID=128251 RepID=A0ABP0TAS1_9BRYO